MTRTTQTKELKVYQQQDVDVDVDEEEEEKVAPKTIRTINGSDHSLSFATFPAIGVHPTPGRRLPGWGTSIPETCIASTSQK